MQSASPSSRDPGINHQDMANALRFISMDAVQKAHSGHPGMPMGMADIATVLFTKFLKFDPQHPQWPDRDRFILSNGHGSMLLYSLLYLTGYKGMTLDQLKSFRQLGSHTPGHPEVDQSLGIETTTGPLGQGIANAVGMAIAERHLNARFGNSLVNHYTYVFAGDGCLMEGISHEAISLAGHLDLRRLILFFDNNGITIDGKTDLSVSDDQLARFEACQWHVQEVDGHDPKSIEQAIIRAQHADKPSLISCKTIIGFGAPTKAGTASTHGAPLGEEEIAAARRALGWNYKPFEIPEDILAAWRDVGAQNTTYYMDWENRLSTHAKAEEYKNRLRGVLKPGWDADLQKLKNGVRNEAPVMATRKLSEKVLTAVVPHIPQLIGGSADLTGSNNTKTLTQKPLTKFTPEGRYIYYGIREHAMAAVMNGLALHGGFIPYGGTFLTFSDYCRPAIRLSALMGAHVIYVMTHDSIGLGEDGPTHQPIEHLASLRAIPNLLVFRPADGIETVEAWEFALQHTKGPSVIALSRQKLPTIREDIENKSQFGAYDLDKYQEQVDITLIASGSEVSLAQQVQTLLEKDGIIAKVVSAPCLDLFDLQSDRYKSQILPPNSLKVAIEAASPQPWHKYVGLDGMVIGMERFGASAPYKDLYDHFGFTAKEIHRKITIVWKKRMETHDN